MYRINGRTLRNGGHFNGKNKDSLAKERVRQSLLRVESETAMNNDAWIKFWEGTIYHPIWRDDPVAWRIFEYLLVTSYRGQPQGTTVKTTQQIADACFGGSGKNGTCYKAIKRLEKCGMVKTESTNKRTTFKIVNWWKYQGNGSVGKNEVKTQQKHSNTLYKNKIKDKEKTVGYIEEFILHRKAIKAPLTELALTKTIAKLEQMYPGNEKAKQDCVEQSIINGWKGIFALKESDTKPKVETLLEKTIREEAIA